MIKTSFGSNHKSGLGWHPLVYAALISAAVFSTTSWAAKGGNGNPGGGEDPVFTVESSVPLIPAVDSYSLDRGGHIVFRNAEMDLSEFSGTNADGACHHGFNEGTLTLKPKSDKNPAVARLHFWFKGRLDSGALVTHLFAMEGDFNDPGDWPPSDTTSITFDYWEVAAENRKAQRQDCAGDHATYPDANSWTITVTRKQ